MAQSTISTNESCDVILQRSTYSNIHRNNHCWNWFGIEYAVWDQFMYLCYLSIFLFIQQLKIFESQIERKKNRPTKHPREKTWAPPNTHEKKLLTQIRWHDGTRPTKFSTQNSAHSEAATLIHFAVSLNTWGSPAAAIRRIILKIGFLENFSKFKRKDLYRSLFCFSVNITKL